MPAQTSRFTRTRRLKVTPYQLFRAIILVFKSLFVMVLFIMTLAIKTLFVKRLAVKTPVLMTQSMWPIKNHQTIYQKFYKNDFTIKIKDFDNFTKIALKCEQVSQNNCCHSLWKDAQNAINQPIWSQWTLSIKTLVMTLVTMTPVIMTPGTNSIKLYRSVNYVTAKF